MTNIVSIGLANSLPPGEVCQEVIDLLKDWMDRAERGELIQVLMAGVKRVGGSSIEWAGNASMDASLAAAAGLEARVKAAWLSDLEFGEN